MCIEKGLFIYFFSIVGSRLSIKQRTEALKIIERLNCFIFGKIICTHLNKLQKKCRLQS